MTEINFSIPGTLFRDPLIRPQSMDLADGAHLREIKIDHDPVGCFVCYVTTRQDHIVAHEADQGEQVAVID